MKKPLILQKGLQFSRESEELCLCYQRESLLSLSHAIFLSPLSLSANGAPCALPSTLLLHIHRSYQSMKLCP